MLSRRTAEAAIPNALAIALEAKRAAGARVLDLTASNPTRCGLDYPGEAILKALARPEALVYAPDPRGALSARAAVAGYYAARGAAVDPARVVLTASTSEAYSFLLTVLCDPGDALLAPVPSYPLLEHLATLASVRLVPYPIAFDGDEWRIDLDALAQAAGEEPMARAVAVVSPNNPTGSCPTHAEAHALARLCAERGLALVADEVFADYLYPGAAEGAGTLAGGAPGLPLDEAPLAFVLNGLSKVAGLPQLKLAWIAPSGPARLVEPALERLDLVADTFLSVGAPVQAALPALLDLAPQVQRQILARVTDNRGRLAAHLGPDSPCRLLPAAGGWYAVLRVPRGAGEEALVLDLLEQNDVLVHPGYFFDFPTEAYLVVSLLPEPAVFDEAVGLVLARVSR